MPPHRLSFIFDLLILPILPMITVTFALPQESQDFQHALKSVETVQTGPLPILRGRVGEAEVLVGHTGVGPESAAKKSAVLLKIARPRLLISTGFAGGLAPRLGTGDLLVAENLSDATLIARSRTLLAHNPHAFFGGLASQPQAAETVAAKAALAEKTGALGVDMETASVAVACARAGVPFLSVRAISDSAREPLPVPFAEWFDLSRQRPRPFSLIKYLAFHPRQIAPFTRFVRGLTPARQAFTHFITTFITDYSSSSSFS
jgi:adenosylhomocysteine nucleosidase